MNGRKYNSKVDIWSLGTMMYELLVGFTPFTGHDPYDLAERVNEGVYGVPKNVKLSLSCLDLLNKCLTFEPLKRINHDDLMMHPFLNESSDEKDLISLSTSCGPEQASFFEAPSNGLEVNEKNAVIFNVKDSCLFNDMYQKTLKKFQQKTAEGVQIIQEPDEPKDEEVKELPQAETSDMEDNDESSFIMKKDTFVDNNPEENDRGIVMDANGRVEVLRSTKIRKNSENSKAEEDPNQDKLENSPKIEEKPVEEPSEAPVEDPECHNDPSQKPHEEIGDKNDGGQILIDKPEVPESPVESEPIAEIPNPNLDELEDENSSESSEEEDNMDFTVIDYKQLQPINEVSESMEKSTTIKKKKQSIEEPEPEPEEKDDLDSSFEIVHYHDIQMMDKHCLIASSRVV